MNRSEIKGSKKNTRNKVCAKIIAYIFWIGIIGYTLINATDSPRYDLVFTKNELLLNAIGLTIGMSIGILVFSMVFGFGLYIATESKNYIIKYIFTGFKEIAMGTPLIVMIFLVVYVFAPIINVTDKNLLGCLSIILYMSAYVSNSYKSVIDMIDQNQYVVMNLYDFNLYQRYRYVILPQIMRPYSEFQ